MPYQQQQGGNSCGACSASYVLEDFGKKTFNNWNDVQTIWDNIKLAKNPILPDGYSDPTRIAEYLSNTCGLPVECCIESKSSLNGLLGKGLLKDEKNIQKKDGIIEIKKDVKKIAIAIYAGPSVPKAPFPPLHYMATKFDGTGIKLIDSNDNDKDRTWKDASSFPIAGTYTYTGACIVVTKK